MSFLAMFKLVPRWMWLGLAVLAVMVGLTRWHNGRVDDAVARERDRLGAVYAQELADAQAKADEKTKANATTTGTIDTQKYQELQNAKNTISDLRSQLRTGAISVRDCATGTDNAKTRTSISMGDGQAPESTGRGQSAGQDILDLAEIAKTAIAQRNYLQDKHVADTKTVNGN